MRAVFNRELRSACGTATAYIYLVAFLLLSGICTFYSGGFFERNQADLNPFFDYLPWLYILLLPALGMRLWAEERKSGSIELLMSLPVSVPGAVLAKFFASWVIAIAGLLLTFPLVLTVNYLGAPDNGAILCGYLASALLAGSFLAICGCTSALTKSPLLAFLLGAAVCLFFIACGSSVILDLFREWVSVYWLDRVASMSVMAHFGGLTQGVIEPRDLLYFISQIIAWLAITVLTVELKKAT
ncbi:heme exporter protein CcmB [Pseudomonas sp. lyk4-TYG-107]|jgi:ABC-2 type transport system permease protein|uniref:heme exporter protein CcmB n=1 Tax=Pseudomonas sp. lyk4-TYG-107 TaxID=3040317 RepID=UPI00255282B6|nr:heme exporter protein CcmB [Pseudomonas sp. lyk4-TYG-107]